MYAFAPKQFEPLAPSPWSPQNRAASALRAYEAVTDAIELFALEGSLKTVLQFFADRRRALAVTQGMPDAELYGMWRNGDLEPALRTRQTYFGPNHPPYEHVVDAYAQAYAKANPQSAGQIFGGVLEATTRGGWPHEIYELTQYRCDLTGTAARNRRWLHTHWKHVDALLCRVAELFEMALEPIDDKIALSVVAEMHWWLVQAMPFVKGSTSIAEWVVNYVFRLRGHGGVRFKQDPASLAWLCSKASAYREVFAENIHFIPTRASSLPMPMTRELARCAREGDRRGVRRWIQSLTPSAFEPTGYTALHLAARQGHRTIVQDLLRQSADVDARLPDSEQTALHLAAREGHEKIVRLLIDYGADIEAKDAMGRSPLHQAVRMRHAGVVAYLVEEGATLDQADNQGRYPIHDAVLHFGVPILRRILKTTSTATSLTAQDGFGETALSLAALNDRFDLVKLLLKSGAAPPQTALGDDVLHPVLSQLSLAVVQTGADLHLFGLYVRCVARKVKATANLISQALLASVERKQRAALATLLKTVCLSAR